ncbi:hypothetical protein SBY92_003297 [Candida maltosa Xu316]|uniref:Uncharacterized protein n=1 Tax=Candida maltosa (strain Xu316) TaxID=1245528 RepID=M3IPK5_CANMX|nr:hypothetical protein G210_1044 [Candida maltosa Xu316]
MLSKTTKMQMKQQEEIDLGPHEPVIPIDQSDNHIVNSWPRQKLYQYLKKEHFYPELDEDLSIMKKQVIEIYEFKKQHEEEDDGLDHM